MFVLFNSFWTVLLMDALPLLETNPPVFTTDQTYELMQSLQELTSSFQDIVEPSNSSSNCDLNPDKIMLITLALSRNLAKCYVQQSICDQVFLEMHNFQFPVDKFLIFYCNKTMPMKPDYDFWLIEFVIKTLLWFCCNRIFKPLSMKSTLFYSATRRSNIPDYN